MRVCIPTLGNKGLDEQIVEHFGYAPTFTIVDLETEKLEVIPNTSLHMDGSGYPPELMQKKGVDIVICSNLGRRAVGMFEEFGVEVYIGAKGTVKDAIEMWNNNMLKMATEKNACKQHAFRKRR